MGLCIWRKSSLGQLEKFSQEVGRDVMGVAYDSRDVMGVVYDLRDGERPWLGLVMLVNWAELNSA